MVFKRKWTLEGFPAFLGISSILFVFGYGLGGILMQIPKLYSFIVGLF